MSICYWKAAASLSKKYSLRQGFRVRLVLNLVLIFHQISGSCSYKIVLIKKIVYAELFFLFSLIVVNHYTVVISKNFNKGGSKHNHAYSLGVAKLQPRPCFQRWKHDNLV